MFNIKIKHISFNLSGGLCGSVFVSASAKSVISHCKNRQVTTPYDSIKNCICSFFTESYGVVV
jgi:hypothetical protein